MFAYTKIIQGIQAVTTAVTDAYFNLVTLLLNTTSTNGAQNNTFLDSSSNNFSITRNGNTTQGTFTPFSQTGWSNFFASGSYISTVSNTAIVLSTGSWTIEAWAFCTGGSGYRSVLSKRTGANAEYEMGIDTSGNFYFYVGSTVYATTTAVPLNAWTNLTITYDGTNLRMFQDGALTKTQASVTAGSGTGNLAISVEAGTGTQAFPGYISNVRITKGGALYTSTFTPSTTPLTTTVSSGTVSFLTCQSNRFVDNSASPLTITVTGTPSVQAFSPFAPTAAYDAAVVGGSGYFDGNGDYLSAASNAAFAVGANTNFTIEAWIYLTSAASSNVIYQTRVSGGLTIGFNAGALFIAHDSVANVATYTYSPPINTWIHIAAVRNGTGTNNTVLYVNGVSVGTGSDNGAYAQGAVYIGYNQSIPGWFFPGYISGLRFVNGSAVYTAAFTPPTAPPTAITNTQLLLSCTNAGIIDAASKNVLETVGNAQVSTTQAKFGTTSMYFDGTGDYLITPSSTSSPIQSFSFPGDYTIECWVRTSSFSTDQGIFDTRNSGVSTLGVTVFFDTNSKINLFMNGLTRITSSTSYSTNTWYHIALVRSGSTNTLYVDGTSVGTYTFSSSLTDNSLTVGSVVDFRDTTSTYHFNGYIDDLRITKGYARYTTTFAPPTAAFPIQ